MLVFDKINEPEEGGGTAEEEEAFFRGTDRCRFKQLRWVCRLLQGRYQQTDFLSLEETVRGFGDGPNPGDETTAG
jgi:hypothetical protein